MVTKTRRKARAKPITWLMGNRKRGVSVQETSGKYVYLKPRQHKRNYRVAVWRNGKIVSVDDNDTRDEAMNVARSRAKYYKTWGE